MVYSTKATRSIEEQYKLCKYLYLIKKETDKRNKVKTEQGEECKNLTYMSIFAKPCHISKLFGPFMKLPLYNEIATLKNHKCRVFGLTHFNNKLYHGSQYGSIYIRNTETHEEIAILRGHTDGVRCLTFNDNKLYSGSWDGTIRIWNTETYEEIATLRGHTYSVRCLTIHENKLYSGSDDKTICVWKI